MNNIMLMNKHKSERLPIQVLLTKITRITGQLQFTIDQQDFYNLFNEVHLIENEIENHEFSNIFKLTNIFKCMTAAEYETILRQPVKKSKYPTIVKPGLSEKRVKEIVEEYRLKHLNKFLDFKFLTEIFSERLAKTTRRVELLINALDIIALVDNWSKNSFMKYKRIEKYMGNEKLINSLLIGDKKSLKLQTKVTALVLTVVKYMDESDFSNKELSDVHPNCTWESLQEIVTNLEIEGVLAHAN